jgi:hypothetical protein
LAGQRFNSKVKVSIEGLEKLEAAVKRTKQRTYDVLGPATLAGAELVRDNAKKRVRRMIASHRTQAESTGSLERGINAKVTWDKKKSKAFSGVGMDRTMNHIFQKIASTGQFYYPASIEYGHPRAKAYPFLKPALKSQRAKIKKIIAERIRAALNRGGG